MSAHNIVIAFHGVDAQHKIIPLELDGTNQLKTQTHLAWSPRIAQICKACKAKGLSIAPRYKKNSAQKWLHLLLIDTEHLQSPKFFDQIPGSALRPVKDPEIRHKNKSDKKDGRYDPVITISAKDFLDLNTKPLSEELANKRKRDLHDKNIDTRAKFLDSSIWHRYVPEMPGANPDVPNLKTPTFQTFFKEVLEEIIQHWAEGLYYTVSAVTTLEFQLRMLRHSFIAQFGDGGHAGVVTPFKFHSERHLQTKTELSEDNFLTKKHNGKNLLSAVQWRMLLVDDYANETLSTIGKGYPCTTKKHELVRRPLDRLYKSQGIDADARFELISPEVKQSVIDFSTDALRQRTFDVIFLDYLLGERPNTSKSPKNREYGHELLLRLIEDSRKMVSQYHRDFFGRYWIFPVSSFPFALSDKLAQLGIGHLHSIWHLSGGGDPVTTPHLYGFYLFRFLKQKIAEYYLYPRALQRLLNEIPNFPNTQLGAKRWAKCISTTLEHYKSRIDVVEDSKTDNSQSPFLKTMADFLSKQVKISNLLDRIIGVSKSITSGNLLVEERINSVQALEKLIKNEFPEYEINLEGFLEKAKHHKNKNIERVLNEIAKAKETENPYLDLNGNSLNLMPEEIIDELPNLIDLSLANNKLKEVPLRLSHLSDLQSLNLSENAINNLSGMSSLLDALTSLESLDLRGNPIVSNIPPEFHYIEHKDIISEFINWLSKNSTRLTL